MFSIAMRTEKERKDSGVQNANRYACRKNRTGIPTQLKERMEQSTGLSFDDVRVHYNSNLPARFDALAYTKGNQVEIGPGQECHLPHELGHVVQQKLGIVRANAKHSSGASLNTEGWLERQADEIGAGKKISVVQGCWSKMPETDVIQRFTDIIYFKCDLEGDIQPTSTMFVNSHIRVGLRDGEKDRATCYDASGRVRPNNFNTAGLWCHHHAAYSMVENAIKSNYLHSYNVIDAIRFLNIAIGDLNTVARGRYRRIPPVSFCKFQIGMSKQFDDAIANIANDPRNLFYAIYHRGDGGGTQLDWPTDANGQNIANGDVMFDYSNSLQRNNLI